MPIEPPKIIYLEQSRVKPFTGKCWVNQNPGDAKYILDQEHEKGMRAAALFAWKRLGRMERGILPMQEFEDVFKDFLTSIKEQTKGGSSA